MRRRILVIVGDARVREKVMKALQPFFLEHDINVIGNYEKAYKIVADKNIDVIVCGPSDERYGQKMGNVFRFIYSIRRINRYYFTPVILVSDIEDPSNYCYRELQCMDVIDSLSVEARLFNTVERALCYREAECEEKILYILEQNVLYPIKCDEISHIQASNRLMEVHLKDGCRRLIRYVTMQQLLDIADVHYLQQCSRSSIVNVNYVQNIDYTNHVITMKNHVRLAIGSTYLKTFRERFRSVQELLQEKKRNNLVNITYPRRHDERQEKIQILC